MKQRLIVTCVLAAATALVPLPALKAQSSTEPAPSALGDTVGHHIAALELKAIVLRAQGQLENSTDLITARRQIAALRELLGAQRFSADRMTALNRFVIQRLEHRLAGVIVERTLLVDRTPESQDYLRLKTEESLLRERIARLRSSSRNNT